MATPPIKINDWNLLSSSNVGPEMGLREGFSAMEVFGDSRFPGAAVRGTFSPAGPRRSSRFRVGKASLFGPVSVSILFPPFFPLRICLGCFRGYDN